MKTNYRNSQGITKLSNDLLKIKNSRFGSIDRESTYLINTVADSEGEINFLKYDKKLLGDLNKRTESSARFAVLAIDKDRKARIGRELKTPLIFTIQEAKGSEYENIILVNFISDYKETFRFMEIIEEIPASILPDYRRKRQYVSSILSKNEKDREDRYNKRFLIRRARGCYDLNPGAALGWEGEDFQAGAQSRPRKRHF